MSEHNALGDILGWIRGLKLGIRVDSLKAMVMTDSNGKIHAISTKPPVGNGSCDEARYPCTIEEIKLKDAATCVQCEACAESLVDTMVGESKLLKYAKVLMELDTQASGVLPDDPKGLADLHFQLGTAMARSWVRGLLYTMPGAEKMINLVNAKAAETQRRALLRLRSGEMRIKLTEEARSQAIPAWAGCGSDWPEDSDVVIGIMAFQYGEEIDPYVLAFEVPMRKTAHTVILAPYPVFKLLDAKIDTFAYCLVESDEDGWALAETISHLWDPIDPTKPFSSFTTAAGAARNCIRLPVLAGNADEGLR